MLIEFKTEDEFKRIITDYNDDIKNLLITAESYIKNNVTSINTDFNNNFNKYILIIKFVASIRNKYSKDYLNTYSFDYTLIDINNFGIEYDGFIKINKDGRLIEFANSIYNDDIQEKEDIKYSPIFINLNDNYSLNIESDDNVSVNNGLLKFNDNNAKISVINNLKKKLNNKENLQ